MSILRRLFALYDAEPMDLVFYLKDMESEKAAEASRYEVRKRYWTYALPIIQKQHVHRGSTEEDRVEKEGEHDPGRPLLPLRILHGRLPS